MQEKQKKKFSPGRLLINLGIVVCLIVLVYSVSQIFLKQQEYARAEKEYDGLAEQYGVPETADTLEGYVVDVAALQAGNEDCIGWIYIPGTNVNYPIMQSADNDYYLRRTFEREYNASGSIFMDYASRPDFSDSNTIVYGHNMRNSTMFSVLGSYLDAAYMASHSEVIVYTADEILRYEVFSARSTDVNDPGYQIGFIDENNLLDFFSNIGGGPGMAAEDKVLTLSTCTNSADNDDERYLIHAVLVSREGI